MCALDRAGWCLSKHGQASYQMEWHRCTVNSVHPEGCEAPTPTVATPFDGLYRPSAYWAEGWSCSEEFLGVDGGSVGIVDGYLEGVENRCQLDEVKRHSDHSIQYRTVCSSEGETTEGRVVIERTETGIVLDDGRGPIHWTRCDAETLQPHAHQEGQWGYANRVASITQEGVQFFLTCEAATPSTTLPVAGLVGHCPMCAHGDTAQIAISVDERTLGVYEFIKGSNADGWRSFLNHYPTWYETPIVELTEGSVVSLKEYGSEVARFSLNGSAKAIEALRSDCN